MHDGVNERGESGLVASVGDVAVVLSAEAEVRVSPANHQFAGRDDNLPIDLGVAVLDRHEDVDATVQLLVAETNTPLDEASAVRLGDVVLSEAERNEDSGAGGHGWYLLKRIA